MEEYRAIVAENGRIIIPAKLRNILKLKSGTELLFRHDNNIVQMMTMRSAVREAQRLVKMYEKNINNNKNTQTQLNDKLKHIEHNE